MARLQYVLLCAALLPACLASRALLDDAGGNAKAPSPAPSPSSDYTYENDGQDWSGVCNTGMSQSPINIQPAVTIPLNVTEDLLPRLSFGSGRNVSVYNPGHTIQVTWQTLANSSASVTLGDLYGQPNATGNITASGPGGAFTVDARKRVPLTPLQWHVHTPSEHTVNGMPAAMELHLVSSISQKDAPACAVTGCLAVVAVLYDLGPTNNTKLEPILANLPQQKGLQNAKAMPAGFELAFQDFLSTNASTFVTYSGSLTTPPCTEGVLWTVLTSPNTISEAQLATLKYALSSGHIEESGPMQMRCFPVKETPANDGSGPEPVAAGINSTDCSLAGRRINDRFPQPLNGRPVWGHTDDVQFAAF
uniref:carbonic anhydrase n=1 Tax=Lobosphaera incisa TaxID=312850 RepID=A0A0D5CNL5_9CHLO|nr:alpha type carbonic anhydrase [Lobosphaera incisa]